ncbi:hypothetical protein PS662_05384 [Pseudomonas fluorescens]|uniref:Uncharacterized protein n=1 Tax=Pseudomonas fluorescens TaxID=294 RepID=A0A5E6XGD9_PSEFL|nr:hypothetical protein PS662_05384 [Pseudomonas fluorescens]
MGQGRLVCGLAVAVSGIATQLKQTRTCGSEPAREKAPDNAFIQTVRVFVVVLREQARSHALARRDRDHRHEPYRDCQGAGRQGGGLDGAGQRNRLRPRAVIAAGGNSDKRLAVPANLDQIIGGNVSSSLSRVIGYSRTRTPVALYTALAIAALTPHKPSSPTPLAFIGEE